jgi:hypothetical protein
MRYGAEGISRSDGRGLGVTGWDLAPWSYARRYGGSTAAYVRPLLPWNQINVRRRVFCHPAPRPVASSSRTPWPTLASAALVSSAHSHRNGVTATQAIYAAAAVGFNDTTERSAQRRSRSVGRGPARVRASWPADPSGNLRADRDGFASPQGLHGRSGGRRSLAVAVPARPTRDRGLPLFCRCWACHVVLPGWPGPGVQVQAASRKLTGLALASTLRRGAVLPW